MQRTSKNPFKQWIYNCRRLWIAGRRDSTLFAVIDDTTTTKFTSRACTVHCNSLSVVVVVLKFPIDVYTPGYFLIKSTVYIFFFFQILVFTESNHLIEPSLI